MERLDPDLLKLIIGICNTGALVEVFPTLAGRVLGISGVEAPPGLRVLQEQFLTPGELTLFASGLRRIGLPVSATLVDEMEPAQASFPPRHADDLFAELGRQIQRELKSIELLVIPLDKAHFLKDGSPFGKAVAERFSQSVSDDVSQAGRCIALGNNTAAVFHLMRVVEAGLNVLKERLGCDDFSPSWNSVFQRIDARLKVFGENKKDDDSRRELRFISEARVHIEAIKNAWRNPVIHDIAQTYDEREALRVYAAVRALMEHIATTLPDVSFASAVRP